MSDTLGARSWTRSLGLLLAVGTAAWATAFALALPPYIDEAYTHLLATDASWQHLLAALAQGADGTLPPFALYVHGWARLCGDSELSLRLAGALFALPLVLHLARNLRQRYSRTATALALLLILANAKFICYVVQARFYGCLLLAFSLAFWSTWRLVEDRTVGARHRLWHAAVFGLLFLAHPLGMLYGGLLALLYGMFALQRRTFSLANCAAFAGGPLLFLVWLPSFLQQRRINVEFPLGAEVAGLGKYWQYLMLDSRTFTVVGAIALIALLPRLLRRRHDSTSMPPGLAWFAIALIAVLNLAIALIDALGLIQVYLMNAVRYVLVTSVAFAVVFAAAYDRLAAAVAQAPNRHVRTALRVVAATIVVVTAQGLTRAWTRWMRVRTEHDARHERIVALAQREDLGLLCATHIDAFLLARRYPAVRIDYVLADDFPWRHLMTTMSRHYPRPKPRSAIETALRTQDFVFVPEGGEASIVRVLRPPR